MFSEIWGNGCGFRSNAVPQELNNMIVIYQHELKFAVLSPWDVSVNQTLSKLEKWVIGEMWNSTENHIVTVLTLKYCLMKCLTCRKIDFSYLSIYANIPLFLNLQCCVLF